MVNERGEPVKPANGDHQERPSNGASIGAYVDERHLPPVSFGGLIMVDDKLYGMTVHHMLDDPDDGDNEQETQEPILRSSAAAYDMPDLTYAESSVYSSGDEEFMYDLTDYESDFTDDQSDFGLEDDDLSTMSDDEYDDGYEPGDVKGIPQGCGEEYIITQPAIDDVDEEFYPSEDTRDEDHLLSCNLGEVYASSGIRRRVEDGTVHEIDWALFEFNPDRCPDKNCVSTSTRFGLRTDEYPLTAVATGELAGLDVHCMARTSGLQTGRILPGMVIVKIYGRQTPSASYQVAGRLGVPGDSGAWIVDNDRGRACGHVLAWSSKKQTAYICPMDVLLRDIGETLNAQTVAFPGGDDVYSTAALHDTVGSLDQVSDLFSDLKMAPAMHEIVSPMSPNDPAVHEIMSPLSPESPDDSVPAYTPITMHDMSGGLEKSASLVRGATYRLREIVDRE